MLSVAHFYCTYEEEMNSFLGIANWARNNGGTGL